MPISLLRRLGIAYRLICERYRQRRQLLEMDDRQLKDIGITREEAELEVGGAQADLEGLADGCYGCMIPCYQAADRLSIPHALLRDAILANRRGARFADDRRIQDTKGRNESEMIWLCAVACRTELWKMGDPTEEAQNCENIFKDSSARNEFNKYIRDLCEDSRPES